MKCIPKLLAKRKIEKFIDFTKESNFVRII